MDRRKKIIIISVTTVLSCVVIVSLILVGALLFSIWYETFDVIGLEFYNGEKIETISTYSDQLYIVTEDNKVYITGGYRATESRKYRNVEFYYDEALNVCRPVLIFNKPIKEILPYKDMAALFITESGELYEFDDLNLKKISENVSYATKAKYDNSTIIYTVDSDGKLFSIVDGEQVFLCDNVKKAAALADNNLILLMRNGELRELAVNPIDNSISLSDSIIDQILDFDIGVPAYLSDKAATFDGKEIDLFRLDVLTNDNKLYSKGVYTFETYHYSSPEAMQYNENWTLIYEGVADFASSHIGTVMQLADGGCMYYGYDTVYLNSYEPEELNFGYKKLYLSNVEEVFATQKQVCVCAEDKWYFWCGIYDDPFLRDDIDQCQIFYDEPYVLSQ